MTQLTSRAMMVRLGFSHDAADEIFNAKGIDLIYEQLNLDDENVKILLRNIRKTGGGGQCEMISFKAEINLYLNIFFVFHNNHTIQSVDYSDITVPKNCALKKQREMDSDEETKPEAPTINLKDFSKTNKAIIQYLCGMRGCDGVPLKYVALPTISLMPVTETDNPSDTYATYDEEMVKIVSLIESGHATNAT